MTVKDCVPQSNQTALLSMLSTRLIPSTPHVLPPPPPHGNTFPRSPGEPSYHLTHTLWGTGMAAENERTKHKKLWCAEIVKVKTQ